jgi:CheY-like chemotaxis protein
VVDDESEVAELFRQRFRREVRQGSYSMHFATSGEEALEKLVGGIEPTLIVILSDINMPGMNGLTLLREEGEAARPAGDKGNGLWRRQVPASGRGVRRRTVHYQAG